MTEPLARYQARIETALSCVLPPAGERLADAMRYATLGGGKPLLLFLVFLQRVFRAIVFGRFMYFCI